SKRVVIEDTPYFVLGLEGSASEGFTLRLSDETREKLEPATLLYRPGRLTARVKSGQERAKFLNPAYFDLLSDLQEDEQGYFLVIGGTRVELSERIRSFEEFWPFYVEQHSNITNQRLHVAGVFVALVTFARGRSLASILLGIASGYALS